MRPFRKGIHIDIPEHIYKEIKRICIKRGITMTRLIVHLLVIAIKEDRA